MGASLALSGIRGCISILHGSQGCATYIRRHMATHFNEPVDIASSSLTEEGTVFGGEKNLISGLENMIQLYDPEIIGVATTCLAETIGEDVAGILKKFREKHPESQVKIVNVSSAGYGGTQYEGFFRALRALTEQISEECEKGDYINVITPQISPADTRWLRSFLDEAGIQYILLPDLSENLDGVSVSVYERLKKGGTSVREIQKMSGAKLTIEMSDFIEDSVSPAVYLKERYGVPFERIPLPTGIGAMDRFMDIVESAGGKITERMKKERGRYLDAMVDAHKYAAEARVCIFGEPDFVKSVCSLCCEIGAVPVIAATGSVCPDLREALQDMMQEASDRVFAGDFLIADDADFDHIDKWCGEYGINLMIGSSDGRRIAAERRIPLIRCAFPIHDHVGGQRVQTLGFEGSFFLIDGIANDMLDRVHSTYREELSEKYLKGAKEKHAVENGEKNLRLQAAVKTASHPCFSCSGCSTYARMHIPVAPRCNIQCNYCVRKFDCPNESRPGVTTEVLSPQEALERYKEVKKAYPELSVVGVAGPGDALANFEETRKSLELIREYDPSVTFCVSTNGLMLPIYADELIRLGVTHVTVTMNACDPEIGAKIYRHIDYMGMKLKGSEAASVLLANQMAGIRMLSQRGVVVKVNCVAIKGINDIHILEVTKKAKELGAFMTNIMPHIPVKGSALEGIDRLNQKEIDRLREECEMNILQMRHCRQCRADAVGRLEEDMSIRFRKNEKDGKSQSSDKPCLRFAVATKSGMIVDMHFGRAEEFYIYETDGKNVKFVEKRNVSRYCSESDCSDKNGSDGRSIDSRIEQMIRIIGDCSCVLALRIGDSPQTRLKQLGIRAVSTYDTVEHAVLSAARM